MIKFGKNKLLKDHDPKKNGKALQNTIIRLINNKDAQGEQKKIQFAGQEIN